MESPKNLLKGNSQGNNQASPVQSKQNPLISQLPPKRPMGQNSSGGSGNKKIWTMFIVGIILGGLLTWVFIGHKESGVEAVSDKGGKENTSMATGTSDMTENTTGSALTESSTGVPNSYQARKDPIIISGSNEISVQNQTAGMKVEVELAKFSVSGWVAIHEDSTDREGGLGNILGAQRLDPGIHLTEVELLRPTVAGGKYHAVMYVDDGDKQFDSSKDAPVKDADGKLIESVFTTN